MAQVLPFPGEGITYGGCDGATAGFMQLVTLPAVLRVGFGTCFPSLSKAEDFVFQYSFYFSCETNISSNLPFSHFGDSSVVYIDTGCVAVVAKKNFPSPSEGSLE